MTLFFESQLPTGCVCLSRRARRPRDRIRSNSSDPFAAPRLALADTLVRWTRATALHFSSRGRPRTAGLTAVAFQRSARTFPALPEFQRELGGSTAWVTWVLAAFLVSAAVTTPVLGKLGDQFGKERMLLISLSIFFVGDRRRLRLEPLVADRLRALAGAGGALFRSRLRSSATSSRPSGCRSGSGSCPRSSASAGLRHRALGRDRRPLLVAAALRLRVDPGRVVDPARAPVRAGVADPDAVAGRRAGLLLLSGAPHRPHARLTEGGAWGWTSPAVVGLGVLSLAFFVVWGLVELRVPEPMVDLAMLAYRPILLTNVTTLISGFALFSCFVLVPAFVAAPRAAGTGSAPVQPWPASICPSSVAMLFSGPLAGVVGALRPEVATRRRHGPGGLGGVPARSPR